MSRPRLAVVGRRAGGRRRDRRGGRRSRGWRPWCGSDHRHDQLHLSRVFSADSDALAETKPREKSTDLPTGGEFSDHEVIAAKVEKYRSGQTSSGL